MSQIDLYAPLERDGLSTLYGCAAASSRIKTMFGNANIMCASMLEAGFKMGLAIGMQNIKKLRR